MIVLTNLRDLLVQHECLTRDNPRTPAPGTVDMESGEVVVFRKAPDVTVLMLDEEGESILAVKKPPRVVVPMGFLGQNTPENLENAIQDRLLALLEAAVHGGETPQEFPTVPANQIVAFLSERFPRYGNDARRPALRALMMNQATAFKIHGPSTRVFIKPVADGLVYGLAQPEYVGHLIEDTSRHHDDRMMDEANRVPFPASTRVGMFIHGGVTVAKVTSE